MALSGDGKRVSFLAGEDGGSKRLVVLGDLAIVEAGWVVDWPLAMTDDASVVAYRLNDATSGKACVAVNGRRGKSFDAVGNPVLSEDGKVVAYRAQIGNTHCVVSNDTQGAAYDFVKGPALSPDGRSVAYAAARGHQWYLVTGTTEHALDVEPTSVFIGSDSRFAGWTYPEALPGGGSRTRVATAAGPGEAFDLVGRPCFSPDGSEVAYFAERGDKSYIVVGARELQVEGQPGDPVFGADGRRVGYGARVGRELWWTELAIE